MLTAIGIIIILKQIPHAFGYDKNAEGDLSFFQIDGNNTFSTLLEPFSKIDLGVTIITAVALFILILWEKPFMKKFKLVPGALVAVIASVLINEFIMLYSCYGCICRSPGAGAGCRKLQ
jgi:MFS superfamily sulfate permease-like transporter